MTPFQKLTWWLQRRRREDQLAEELQFHLAEEAAAREAAGATADQARREARRDLGNVTRVVEDARPLWSWILIEQLTQDVRYGFRTMIKNPTFTVLAALSLALGIGANTAIYSFVYSIMFRALPVPDAASVVLINWHVRTDSLKDFVMKSTDGRTYKENGEYSAGIFPYPAYEHLQEISGPVLSTLFGHFPGGSVNVIAAGSADVATTEYVSGGFFGGLGVLPAAGRLLVPDDDRVGAPPAVVLSTRYSRGRFGGDAEAVGRTITINNVPFTVAGVTTPDFSGVDPAEAPDVYLPMRAMLLFDPGDGRFQGKNYYWVQMMGRLRPGVSRAQAQAVLAPSFAQWVTPTASTDRERATLPLLLVDDGGAGLSTLRRQFSRPLYVLFGMVGLILAIACGNTANLLLARAAARRREIAIRLGIGAGRLRVIRQLLAESVLLASLSGALGLFIAWAGIRMLTRLVANGSDTFTLHAQLNWPVLVATAGLALLCGIVFGLAPAIQATRPQLVSALKDRSGEQAARIGVLPRVSLTKTLIVAQFAVSALLLVAAGLFVRTLLNLQSVPLGFTRDNVLLFEVNAPQAGYPAAQVTAFYAGLRQRLEQIPGVRGATLSHAPLIRAGRQRPITVNGAATPNTRIMDTGPAFMSTLQIRLLRGREIDDRDRAGNPPAVVVSDLFAKTFFPGQDAIGQHLTFTAARINGEIVGVAADVQYGGLKGKPPAVVYLPYAQLPAGQVRGMTYAVRTDNDPLRYVPAVRQAVQAADARVPMTNIRTLGADIDQTINQEIVFARLCSTFATLALVIACVGLYGTMAYAVARRTAELGIRMALGASRSSVIWMVLREVTTLALLGLAISVPVALVSSKVLGSFLFRLQPNDPRTLVLAAVILIVAALAAGFQPARRASRVDPLIALRQE